MPPEGRAVKLLVGQCRVLRTVGAAADTTSVMPPDTHQ